MLPLDRPHTVVVYQTELLQLSHVHRYFFEPNNAQCILFQQSNCQNICNITQIITLPITLTSTKYMGFINFSNNLQHNN